MEVTHKGASGPTRAGWSRSRRTAPVPGGAAAAPRPAVLRLLTYFFRMKGKAARQAWAAVVADSSAAPVFAACSR